MGVDSVGSVIFYENGLIENPFQSDTAPKVRVENSSEYKRMFYTNEDGEKLYQDIRNEKINQYIHEITAIIRCDEYIDGEISNSQIFMEEAFEHKQLEYVIEALMQIYYTNIQDPHVLEGVLVMISSVPYESIEPKGQIIALGLLVNNELVIRDRAIQCFERWNSKKGLNALRSINCHPKWLQNYVEKVIMYIERDGIE